jgi:hypothetical protein
MIRRKIANNDNTKIVFICDAYHFWNRVDNEGVEQWVLRTDREYTMRILYDPHTFKCEIYRALNSGLYVSDAILHAMQYLDDAMYVATIMHLIS